ncbi:MAG: hypothetical protein A2725_03325 [Candidatus Magasanikbacteria bacterium RIFCSPHIGHO2_01_FULL_33_34]|uniref:Uncharacterized protein n=1 Tax=Candidatus Magasanikbacteria bacterium RIFCSPHIGHO2_01_FULL_33_34 TaxID=1798671 RepID=A0A1F6LH64_9BACT|nr:MAG: hypothetical protein A2725_03325 [Candidatus Magasanikbacteria bacterium RIFCSPHIGHO2_01_FULL_33_34]OGH66160.1 MAG: hypothetical protein A3B83_00815 [Candidatus Magasanikbacteria bacterium RIFCSPHIGHO2_02_FULL_33_17]OGH76006.1 MAG: hypothetical protein A3A89_00725 [Candidatus Magasanikbacteria bacterium RIFCSPLOWO2_01_FULL_33_34]OGH81619.1 MAG: hypothetical protein A3F93_04785 [Candidatus Magasanikbacteria bacterium RIFCSPLOWO2_12_FULL_34_7]
MKKLIILIIIFFSAIGFFLVSVDSIYAQSNSEYGLKSVASAKSMNVGTPSEVIGKVIGGALAFVSVIFFLLTIYGGIIWMTARGNEQQTDKATKTIVSAVIGLVIVLGSYVIVGLIFRSIGASVQCVNRLDGLTVVACSDTEPCDFGTSLVSCSPTANVCISNDDSLCTSQCGDRFECSNPSDCVSGTALVGYCTGGTDNVCCIPK